MNLTATERPPVKLPSDTFTFVFSRLNVNFQQNKYFILGIRNNLVFFSVTMNLFSIRDARQAFNNQQLQSDMKHFYSRALQKRPASHSGSASSKLAAAGATLEP